MSIRKRLFSIRPFRREQRVDALPRGSADDEVVSLVPVLFQGNLVDARQLGALERSGDFNRTTVKIAGPARQLFHFLNVHFNVAIVEPPLSVQAPRRSAQPDRLADLILEANELRPAVFKPEPI